MKNSPYEKVGLVVLAYIIGFTASFIAFGVDDTSLHEDVSFYSDTYVKPVKEIFTLAAVENDTGLFAVIDGNDRLIGANKASVIEGLYPEETNGYYYDIHSVNISPDARFIYYCEQVSADEDVCDPLIYNVSADKLHRVKVSTLGGILDKFTSEGEWLADGKLKIGDFVSPSSETPWQ